MKEEWKSVIGYSLYEISNYGKIRNIKSGKELSQSLRNNYKRVGLVSNSGQKSLDVHRLVAEHFLPEPSNELVIAASFTVYNKVIVNHLDGDKNNNRSDNLEWTTNSGNMKHSYTSGLREPVHGSTHHKSKLSESDILSIRNEFELENGRRGVYAELARKYNVSNATIRDIISRKIWKHL